MTMEKRRYFRLQEIVGLSYKRAPLADTAQQHFFDLPSHIGAGDAQIRHLLGQLKQDNPELAELVQLLNRKLERAVAQLVIDNDLVTRLAERAHEVSISACGIGFIADEGIEIGAELVLALSLDADYERLHTPGVVVGCDETPEGFYWRVDFRGMSTHCEERLIQFLVRRQSRQLREGRLPPAPRNGPGSWGA